MADEVGSAFVSIIPTARGFGGRLSSSIGGQVDDVGKRSGRRFGAAFTSSSAAPIRSGFGSITALATGVAAVAGIRAFKGLIDDASNLGETTSKVAQIFGQEALPSLQKFARGADTALGQSEQAALDAAAQFGVFGKAAGLQGPALTGFSTKLVTLASDMASFGNTSPEEAAIALGSALRGENEPIRKYGVLLDDATLRQEALRLGLIKTVRTALTPAQKVLAAQAAIMKQTGDAQGDFERTSGGLANQQRILAAQFANVKTSLGRGLLPAATAVVSFVNRSMIPAFGKIRTVVGPVFERIVAGAKALFDLLVKGDFTGAFARIFNVAEDSTLVASLLGIRRAVIKAVKPIRSSLVPALSNLAGLFGRNKDILAAFAVGLGAALIAMRAYRATVMIITLVTKAWAVAQTILNGTFVLNPVVVVGVAVAALAAGIFLAYKRSKTFRAIVASTFRFIGGVVSTVSKQFTTTFLPALRSIGDFLAVNLGPTAKALAQVFTTNVLPALRGLAARFVQVLPTLTAFGAAIFKVVAFGARVAVALLAIGVVIVGKVLPPLIKFTGFLVTVLFASIGKAIGIIAGFVRVVSGIARVTVRVVTAIGRFVAFAVTAFVRFHVAVGVAVGKAVAFVASLPTRAVTALASLGGKLFTVARTAWEKFITGSGEKITALLAIVTGIPARVGSAIGDLGRLLYDAGINVIQGLINGITDKLGDLGNIMGKVAGVIRDHLPFSPAKVGPLSGRGNPLYSGRSISLLLAKGMLAERREVAAALAQVLDINRALPRDLRLASEVSFDELVPARSRSNTRPASVDTAAAAGGGGFVFAPTINNPLPERASETTQTQLRRAAHIAGMQVA